MYDENLPNPEFERQEGSKAKTVAVERKPTPEEVAEHYLTHMPVRSWCPCCVKGKAMGQAHSTSRDQTDKEFQVPVVSVDYAFLQEQRVKGGDVTVYTVIREYLFAKEEDYFTRKPAA